MIAIPKGIFVVITTNNQLPLSTTINNFLFVEPCSRQSFTTSRISTDQLPDVLVKENDSMGILDNFNSTTTVWIGFQKIRAEYHSISDRVTFIDLVNNLGGGMGLFLGLSLLSILTDLTNFILKLSIARDSKVIKIF